MRAPHGLERPLTAQRGVVTDMNCYMSNCSQTVISTNACMTYLDKFSLLSLLYCLVRVESVSKTSYNLLHSAIILVLKQNMTHNA